MSKSEEEETVFFMIRIIRWICIVLCVVSAVAYFGVSFYSEKQTDHIAPEIQMDDTEITVSTQDGLEALLRGITATDNRDGDVTDSIIQEKFSNFILPGVREVTFAAFDAAGNVTKATRTVIYSDYVSPRVSIKEPLRVSLNNSSALLQKIQVIDCIDGDITEQLQILSEQTVSTTAAGEYRMHLQLSNSAGDSIDIPVTVEYYSPSDEYYKPVLQLTDYLIYVKTGEKVDPLSYLKELKNNSDVYTWNSSLSRFELNNGANTTYEELVSVIGLNEIEIENPLDTSVPGIYEILYSFQNDDSRIGSVRLIVVVEE